MDDVRIVTFDPSYAKDFADLNYQWIAANYGVEEHDHDQLDHPLDSVIEPGGEIFFALINDIVAGTVAMIRMDENSFELAKMAVSPKFQGRKLGDLLMKSCIEFARARAADRIILESNTKQTAAINLYRKYGFVEVPLDPNSQFVRANIRMELSLGELQPS